MEPSIFVDDYVEAVHKGTPDWARYAAMDDDGEWYWFSSQPKISRSDRVWHADKDSELMYIDGVKGPKNLEDVRGWIIKICDEIKHTPVLASALTKQVGGSHYKNFQIQPAVFSHQNKLTFLEGDVVKRVCRHRVQGGKGAEDIRKAIHDLELLLELEYKEVP